MNDILIYNAGTSTAVTYAVEELKKLGYRFCDKQNCYGATHMLLNVPSTQQVLPDNIRSNITVIGGNLQLPNPTIDLLKDPFYLAKNAMITAHCAVNVAQRESPYILAKQRILIIGWGRIGKCLAKLLQQMGCYVTVAARKVSDRAMLSVLGYAMISTDNIDPDTYDIIYNTVPVLLIENCTSETMIIELASSPGITGKNVISARGLPGKEAPASSGKLIASTIHRILNEKETIL